MNETLTAVEAAITKLEAERKSNPSAFFSAPGKPKTPDGVGYTAVMDMMARLQICVNRLKVIQ